MLTQLSRFIAYVLSIMSTKSITSSNSPYNTGLLCYSNTPSVDSACVLCFTNTLGFSGDK